MLVVWSRRQPMAGRYSNWSGNPTSIISETNEGRWLLGPIRADRFLFQYLDRRSDEITAAWREHQFVKSPCFLTKSLPLSFRLISFIFDWSLALCLRLQEVTHEVLSSLMKQVYARSTYYSIYYCFEGSVSSYDHSRTVFQIFMKNYLPVNNWQFSCLGKKLWQMIIRSSCDNLSQKSSFTIKQNEQPHHRRNPFTKA